MMGQSRINPKNTMLFGAALVLAVTPRQAMAESDSSACATTAEQAQELRTLHKFREAQEKLLNCAQPTCPAIVRRDCAQWLSEVDKAMPSVVIKATGPSYRDMIAVRVWLDGVLLFDRLNGLAHPVDPGVHQFRFEAEGMIPLEEQVLIREGEDRRMLAVQFTALPDTGFSSPSLDDTVRAHPTPVLPFVLGGVGLVALGSFAYFGIKGRSEASDLGSGCGATKTCSEAQIDHVRRKLQIADVSLGVSLISFGIATWMFVSHERARARENATLQVSAGPGAGTIRLGLTF
jgi:hypothetical protein